MSLGPWPGPRLCRRPAGRGLPRPGWGIEILVWVRAVLLLACMLEGEPCSPCLQCMIAIRAGKRIVATTRTSAFRRGPNGHV